MTMHIEKKIGLGCMQYTKALPKLPLHYAIVMNAAKFGGVDSAKA